MRQGRHRRRGPGRAIGRGLLSILLLLGAALGYLFVVGVPEWLAEDLAQHVDTGSIAVQAGRTKIHPLRGLILEDARFYRKRRVGPPVFEAERVVVRIDPLYLARGEVRVRRVALSRGVVRPGQGRPGRDAGAARGVGRSAGGSRGRTRAPAYAFPVEATECSVEGIVIESLRCELQSDGAALRLANIDATLRREGLRGSVTGEIRHDLRAVVTSARLVARLDPHLLLPVMGGDASSLSILTRRFDFGDDPPRVELTFTRKPLTSDLAVSGEFWFGETAYRDVELLRADGRFEVLASHSNSVVTLDPLFVVRPEGVLSAHFTTRYPERTVDFDATSSIHPTALTHMLGICTRGQLDAFRFDGPVNVQTAGRVEYGTGLGTDFEAAVRGRDMSVRMYESPEYAFRMRMMGLTNTFSGVDAVFCDGRLKGSFALALPGSASTGTLYRVDAVLEDADFERLLGPHVRDGAQDFAGRVSGALELEGRFGDPGSVRGEGELRVREGRVFSLPVFGGLSRMMRRIIPGLDFVLRQSDASAAFTIVDRKIRSEDIAIEGDVLSLTARGEYEFNTRVDFEVRVKLMKQHTVVAKLMRAVTYPISKLFEFRLTGTLAQPHWYAVHFSLDLLKKLGLDRGNGKDDGSAPEQEDGERGK